MLRVRDVEPDAHVRLVSRASASLVAVLLLVVVGLAGAAPALAHNAGAGQPAVAPAGVASSNLAAGYWLVGSDGGVFAFGNASPHGSTGGMSLARPVVGMASTPSGLGYWLVGSDGGVFAFGDALSFGSTGGHHLAAPIVGMAATPSGDGYWLVASDGGIFAFGDARFHGSTGGVVLNKPIVGMAATTSGDGYWLVASDGGIFAFGDARFHGSTGGVDLNKPIVGMAATASGDGYWLVASDGGVFGFGDAVFHGSTGSVALARPVLGMAATASGGGYWLVGSDGGIFSFGDAEFHGSTGGMTLAAPIVGISRDFATTRPPSVTAISPASGPVAGGTPMTIRGTGLVGASRVAFGPNTATNVVAVSGTELTATSPAGSGNVEVTVTTPAGTSAVSSGDRFAYGAVPGAPTDVIAAEGFTCNLLVTLEAPAGVGSSPILTYTVTAVGGGYVFTDVGVLTLGVISMHMTAVPDGIYSFTAHATNATGSGPESAPSNQVLASGCSPAPVPAVTSIAPMSGPVAGGTSVTVTGTGFEAPLTVAFGDNAATDVVVVSETTITATSPAGTGVVPTVDVVVLAIGGKSAASASDLFTYLPDLDAPGAPPKPTVTIVCRTATVAFTAPSPGSSPIMTYTATAPGGFFNTSTGSPVTVEGLSVGSHTFTVTATNSFGTGPPSPPSDAVSTTC
jgi:hypothetical protein